MFIRRLYVQNFRSFRHIDLALPDFSVLVGANAAGKSNFIQVFRFLRDVAHYGIREAVERQGAAGRLVNFRLGDSVPLEVQFQACLHLPSERGLRVDLEYHLAIDFSRNPFLVVDETYFERQISPDSQVSFQLRARRESVARGLPDVVCVTEGDSSVPSRVTPLREGDSILQKILCSGALLLIDAPGTERDGAARMARTVIASDAGRHRFRLHLKRFLPRLSDDEVESVVNTLIHDANDKSKVSRANLPLSGGTHHAAKLIAGLYFTPSVMLVWETPEQGLHPSLLGRMVNSCLEVSTQKPVIITTHSPEVVRFAPLESLLLVERDAEGFSAIRRVADSAFVQQAARGGISLEDLFVDDLLVE